MKEIIVLRKKPKCYKDFKVCEQYKVEESVAGNALICCQVLYETPFSFTSGVQGVWRIFH